MIDDNVLGGRLPRLGSITTGRGVTASSKSGNEYSRPTRSDTLVFHTDDPEVANAVQVRFGGDVLSDSPNWKYDVVTETRDVDLDVLPAGWRQSLEAWSAAKVLRRCDGVETSMVDGRPNRQACICQSEMDSGDQDERACSPSTILTALVDLPVERWGVWEVRSTGWGTASNLKGTMRALAIVGITSGSVPARLSMVDRTTRDRDDKVWEVTDLSLAIAQSQTSLSALAAQPAPASGVAEVGPGERKGRQVVLAHWQSLRDRGSQLGLRETMLKSWAEKFGRSRHVEDLNDEELFGWVGDMNDLVKEAESVVAAEQTETNNTA